MGINNRKIKENLTTSLIIINVNIYYTPSN